MANYTKDMNQDVNANRNSGGRDSRPNETVSKNAPSSADVSSSGMSQNKSDLDRSYVHDTAGGEMPDPGKEPSQTQFHVSKED